MTNIIKAAQSNIVLAVLFVLASVVLFVPAAVSAADYSDGYDYIDTYSPSYDSYDYGYDYIDTYTPSYDDYGYDYIDTYTPSYDSYSPSYGGSSYTGSGYLGGSFLGGSSYLPSRPATGGQTQSQSQAQASNNVNTNVNNNVITINTPAATTPAPTPTYNYPVCTLTVSNYGYNNGYNYGYQPVTLSWTSQYATSGFINNGVGAVNLSGSVTVNPQYTTTYTGTFTGQNGQTVNCSATVTRGSVAYNPTTPYVALSAVPYTGLDLGFWGTVAYWGFLVLWCLVAAYLVVVKKVQNKILNSLNSFLFGSDASVQTPSFALEGANSEVSTYASVAPATKVDAIDDFIMSQINRSAR